MAQEIAAMAKAAADKDEWALFWHMGSAFYFARAMGVGMGSEEIARFLCWATGSEPALDPWEEALRDPEISELHNRMLRVLGAV